MDWGFDLVAALATFGLFMLLCLIGGTVWVAVAMWQLKRTTPRSSRPTYNIHDEVDLIVEAMEAER